MRLWPGPVSRSGMVFDTATFRGSMPMAWSLLSGKIVRPDQLIVPVALFVREPPYGRTQRTRFAWLTSGGIDQRHVSGADVEHIDGFRTGGAGDNPGRLRDISGRSGYAASRSRSRSRSRGWIRTRRAADGPRRRPTWSSSQLSRRIACAPLLAVISWLLQRRRRTAGAARGRTGRQGPRPCPRGGAGPGPRIMGFALVRDDGHAWAVLARGPTSRERGNAWLNHPGSSKPAS
jgi:hypothetical protein